MAPLDEELQGLGIQEIKDEAEASPFDLSPQIGQEMRNGMSGYVYRIQTPGEYRLWPYLSNSPYLACKKIDLSNKRMIKVVKSEIRYLLTLGPVPFTVNLMTAFYVATSRGGTIYLILRPWVELSFATLIEYLSGQSLMSDEAFLQLAPWYPTGKFEVWPFFVQRCINCLACLTQISRHSFQQLFRPVGTEDLSSDSIQFVDGTIPQSPVFDWAEKPESDDPTAVAIRHKDLKPGNILLNWDTEYSILNPLIVDFGASKWYFAPALSPTSGGGTKAYRAPDIHQSTKSDVWSLGCCFTFIEAFLHSGKDGVRHISDILDREGERTFSDCLDEINNFLNGPSIQDQQLTPALEISRRRLRKLVKNYMLERDPDRRCNGYQLSTIWQFALDRDFPDPPLEREFIIFGTYWISPQNGNY
jgi:serine/threonine protein kinase